MDAVKREAVVEIMRAGVFDLVRRWYEQTGEALKLQVVSQRYGRMSRQTGVTLVSLVESDERLVHKMSRRGAVLVAPRELLEAEYPDAIHLFWQSHGVPV